MVRVTIIRLLFSAPAYLFHFLGAPVVLLAGALLFRERRWRALVVAGIVFVLFFEIHYFRYSVPPAGFYVAVAVIELLFFTLWWFAEWRERPVPRRFPILPAIALVFALASLPYIRYAQTHRKAPWIYSWVSVVKSEIRGLGPSLEQYYIDHNTFPPAVDINGRIIPIGESAEGVSAGYVPWLLTTPKAYTSSLPHDPFHKRENGWYVTYRYATNGLSCWVMASRGPDQDDDIVIEDYPSPGVGDCQFRKFMSQFGGPAIEFDATNGTLSPGDVVRVGP